MNLVTLTFILAVGMVQQNQMITKETINADQKQMKQTLSWGENDKLLYMQYGIRADILEMFFIEVKTDAYAREEIFRKKESFYMFSPMQEFYTFQLGMQIKNITVTAEHACYHPVSTYGYKNNQLYGGHNKIYIQGKFRIVEIFSTW